MEFSLEKNKYTAILAVILIVSTIIRFYGISYSYSDENVYIYMGRQILKGFIPYRDFFCAHPPILLYSTAFFEMIFNNIFFGSKMSVLFYSIGTAVLIFLAMKKIADEKTGIISSFLFIFSSNYFSLFDKVLGFDIACFFMILAVYFYAQNKPIKSSTALAFAILSRLFSVFLFFSFFIDSIFELVKIKKNKIKFSLDKNKIYLLLTPAVVLLVFFIFSTFSNIFGQTIFFHAQKQVMPFSYKFSMFVQYLFEYWYISFPALISILFLKDKKIRVIFISFFVLSSGIIFQKLIFSMYFSLTFPFLCMLAGYTFFKFDKNIKALLLVIFVFPVLFNLESFLKKQDFLTVSQITDYIEKNTDKNDTINGYSTIATIVSYLTERELSPSYREPGGFIDTTNKRFDAKVDTIDYFIETLEKSNSKYIFCLLNDESLQGVCGVSNFPEYLQNNCTLEAQFFEQLKGTILIFRRNNYI